MTLIPCRECGQQVSTEAPSCPHCGTPDPARQPSTEPPPDPQQEVVPKYSGPQKKPIAWGKLGWIGPLVVLGVLAVLAAVFGDSDTSPTRSADERQAGAYGVCQDFVKGRLRSPSTARFPWGYTGYIDNLGGGKYRVRRYVDAQNAFGAETRTNFTCTVQLSGDRWRLSNLDMDPQ